MVVTPSDPQAGKGLTPSPQSTPSKAGPSLEWFRRVAELARVRPLILSNPALLQKRTLKHGMGERLDHRKAQATQVTDQPSC